MWCYCHFDPQHSQSSSASVSQAGAQSEQKDSSFRSISVLLRLVDSLEGFHIGTLPSDLGGRHASRYYALQGQWNAFLEGLFGCVDYAPGSRCAAEGSVGYRKGRGYRGYHWGGSSTGSYTGSAYGYDVPDEEYDDGAQSGRSNGYTAHSAYGSSGSYPQDKVFDAWERFAEQWRIPVIEFEPRRSGSKGAAYKGGFGLGCILRRTQHTLTILARHPQPVFQSLLLDKCLPDEIIDLIFRFVDYLDSEPACVQPPGPHDHPAHDYESASAWRCGWTWSHQWPTSSSWSGCHSRPGGLERTTKRRVRNVTNFASTSKRLRTLGARWVYSTWYIPGRETTAYHAAGSIPDPVNPSKTVRTPSRKNSNIEMFKSLGVSREIRSLVVSGLGYDWGSLGSFTRSANGHALHGNVDRTLIPMRDSSTTPQSLEHANPFSICRPPHGPRFFPAADPKSTLIEALSYIRPSRSTMSSAVVTPFAHLSTMHVTRIAVDSKLLQSMSGLGRLRVVTFGFCSITLDDELMDDKQWGMGESDQESPGYLGSMHANSAADHPCLRPTSTDSPLAPPNHNGPGSTRRNDIGVRVPAMTQVYHLKLYNCTHTVQRTVRRDLHAKRKEFPVHLLFPSLGSLHLEETELVARVAEIVGADEEARDAQTSSGVSEGSPQLDDVGADGEEFEDPNLFPHLKKLTLSNLRNPSLYYIFSLLQNQSGLDSGLTHFKLHLCDQSSPFGLFSLPSPSSLSALSTLPSTTITLDNTISSGPTQGPLTLLAALGPSKYTLHTLVLSNIPARQATPTLFAHLKDALPVLRGFSIFVRGGGGATPHTDPGGWGNPAGLGALGTELRRLQSQHMRTTPWPSPPSSYAGEMAGWKNLEWFAWNARVEYWEATPAGLFWEDEGVERGPIGNGRAAVRLRRIPAHNNIRLKQASPSTSSRFATPAMRFAAVPAQQGPPAPLYFLDAHTCAMPFAALLPSLRFFSIWDGDNVEMACRIRRRRETVDVEGRDERETGAYVWDDMDGGKNQNRKPLESLSNSSDFHAGYTLIPRYFGGLSVLNSTVDTELDLRLHECARSWKENGIPTVDDTNDQTDMDIDKLREEWNPSSGWPSGL